MMGFPLISLNKIMHNNHAHPVLDIFPSIEGLGFNGREDWWVYVKKQAEEDRLDLLITMAHLSESVCQSLLAHDPKLFAYFQFSPQTITCFCAIQADSLTRFAAQLIEQRHNLFKSGTES